MATKHLTPEQIEAMKRTAARSKQQLASRGGRITDKPNGVGIDDRTPEQMMEDKALVSTALQIIHQNDRTIDTVRDSVLAIYRGGKNNFVPQDVEAVAVVAYNMGLDPSPASGQLWAWKDWQGNLIIMVGYQGYLAKAREQFEFVLTPARLLNEDERTMLDCKDGDVAVCVELYDVKQGRMWKELGMQPQPIRSYGVWQIQSRYQKAYTGKDGKRVEAHWVADNIPSSKSKFWVAEKRAIMDAIRKLGVQFNMTIPKLDGMVYDPDTDSFYMESVRVDDGDVVNGTLAEPSPEPAKEVAPVVKRNGYDGNGKPIFEKAVEPPPSEPDTQDGDTEPTEPVLEPAASTRLSVSQVGQIRYELRKLFTDDTERLAAETEIAVTYEAETLEGIEVSCFEEILKTIKGKAPKTDANGKPTGKANRPRQKDDATIDPDQFDDIYAAVKDYLTKQDGFIELPEDELKGKVNHQLLTWSGATAITAMTVKHVQTVRDILAFEGKLTKGKTDEG